ncbi:MAG: hypothetical protein ACRC8B_00340, partial [Aeromonas sobria]|uniref:hypothetical protein n=1 Tax=Aeromonas sobria TaxID=646 RepID=UPI003F4079CC
LSNKMDRKDEELDANRCRDAESGAARARTERCSLKPVYATTTLKNAEKSDTKFILDAATTGSLAFNGMVFKTGGTKTIVNYMLAQCKE